MEKLWSPCMEISMKSINYNVSQIRSCISSGVDIMPIIKDNAYKTFLNTSLTFLNNFKIVGISIADEGYEIRNSGYKGEIFILNQPFICDISNIINYNLTIGVSSFDFLYELSKYDFNFKVHIEIDSGMGRTGIKPSQLIDFINKVNSLKNITVDGVYTHFSSAETDFNYTKNQYHIFNDCVKIVKNYFPNITYVHCCNSAGILNFPEFHCNLIRPGIILYGYYPDNSLINKINLKPAIKLKSKISFIKTVPSGTAISYGQKFITKKESKIATIPLGYADGVRRSLSNNNVVINDKLAPIIGSICMDCFMVDVSNIDVKLNDDVFIWDNKNILVDDIAKNYNSINYEVVSTISERVKRVIL